MFTFCKNFFHHEDHFQTAQDICDGHCWANLFYNVYIGGGEGGMERMDLEMQLCHSLDRL